MLYQRDDYNVKRDKWSYPPIPNAIEFQTATYGYEKPKIIHGWSWSTTFNKWGALVTFSDGWRGFTWPKPDGERQSV